MRIRRLEKEKRGPRPGDLEGKPTEKKKEPVKDASSLKSFQRNSMTDAYQGERNRSEPKKKKKFEGGARETLL